MKYFTKVTLVKVTTTVTLQMYKFFVENTIHTDEKSNML